MCQPYTRFSLGTNTKVSSLQHEGRRIEKVIRERKYFRYRKFGHITRNCRAEEKKKTVT